MLMQTKDLTGPALEWAVTKCEVPNDVRDGRPRFWVHPNNPQLICRQTYNYEKNPRGHELCRYATDWSQGGPIIKQKGINIFKYNKLDESEPDKWCGHKVVKRTDWRGDPLNVAVAMDGPEPLIAAMRCYVASKLGDEVEVPDELIGE